MRLLHYCKRNALTEGIQDAGIFKAAFLAGMPGSGKSYILSKVKSGSIEPRWVNTDKLFLDIFPQFKDNWEKNWGKISVKVKTINKNQLALYINSMLPLAIDGTSNSVSVMLRRKGLLEGFGYSTAMIFINTSLETALKRASKRERVVAPEFIEQVYKQMNKAKSFYRKTFSNWIEIPNDSEQLTDEVILNAFKFMSGFYNSPIDNPVGKEYYDKMIENGWKYLSPNIRSMDEIKKVVDVWYKR